MSEIWSVVWLLYKHTHLHLYSMIWVKLDHIHGDNVFCFRSDVLQLLLPEPSLIYGVS